MAATAKCPTCGRPVALSGDGMPASFPFCSDRCRSVDLGRWFNEEFAVPVEGQRVLKDATSSSEEEDSPSD